MRTPDEIKGILNACGQSCKECPGTDKTDDCAEVIMLEALAYIRKLEARIAELEAKPAPAPVQYSLPKGWIELHHPQNGMSLFCNSMVMAMVTNCNDGSAVYLLGESCGNSVKESVKEVLAKIMEAAT